MELSAMVSFSKGTGDQEVIVELLVRRTSGHSITDAD